MNRRFLKTTLIIFALLFFSMSLAPTDASARAGGGRSSGSRGSRSFSSPSRPSSPSPSRQPFAPPPSQPQPGGGFFRNFGAGLLGGLVGGLLFRSLGFGGGGFGGSGIGLFEIILIAGIGYFIYRTVSERRSLQPAYPGMGNSGSAPQERMATSPDDNDIGRPDPLAGGLDQIRRMDPDFDENRFKETVMDNFFKIQSAWMGRNLSPVIHLLTDEMRKLFQADIDLLLRDKKINHLENVAVRKVEISEAWQEAGENFITALIYANLLDYTTDEITGAVVEGSKTEPVKFEEYWTFTAPVGRNSWKLSAINQIP